MGELETPDGEVACPHVAGGGCRCVVEPRAPCASSVLWIHLHLCCGFLPCVHISLRAPGIVTAVDPLARVSRSTSIPVVEFFLMCASPSMHLLLLSVWIHLLPCYGILPSSSMHLLMCQWVRFHVSVDPPISVVETFPPSVDISFAFLHPWTLRPICETARLCVEFSFLLRLRTNPPFSYLSALSIFSWMNECVFV